MPPKVTIGITSYNRPHYLEDCIRSVRMQTYKNIDIVIWDDASNNPRVKEIIEKHRRDDSRITAVYERQHTGRPNKGRNIAILVGKGEYCSFIDDDDYYDKSFVSKMLDSLGNTYTFSYSLINLISSTGTVTHRGVSSYKNNSSIIPLSKLEQGNGITLLEVMFKKNLLIYSGIFDERLPRLMDWDLWLRLYRIAKVKQVWVALSYVRQHNSSTRITTNHGSMTGDTSITNADSFIKRKPKNKQPTCYINFDKYSISTPPVNIIEVDKNYPNPEIILTDSSTYSKYCTSRYCNVVNVDNYQISSVEDLQNKLPTIISMGRAFSSLPWLGGIK